MKGLDAGPGQMQGIGHNRVNLGQRVVDCGLGYPQFVQFHPVDTGGPLPDGPVAPRPHIGQNPAHRLVRADALAKEALVGVQQRVGQRKGVPGLAAQDRGAGGGHVVDGDEGGHKHSEDDRVTG